MQCRVSSFKNGVGIHGVRFCLDLELSDWFKHEVKELYVLEGKDIYRFAYCDTCFNKSKKICKTTNTEEFPTLVGCTTYLRFCRVRNGRKMNTRDKYFNAVKLMLEYIFGLGNLQGVTLKYGRLNHIDMTMVGHIRILSKT